MKRILLALLMLALSARADQVIFQPTSYSPPASLTIDAGVGLFGIWDFTNATVIGLPIGGGLPVGGTTNQVLAKKSATDYDTQWVTPAAGGATPNPNWDTAYTERRQWDGSSTNLNAATGLASLGAQAHSNNLDGWSARPPVSAMPSGGLSGQVLAKFSSGNYDNWWLSMGFIPTGGLTNQVLAKASAADWDLTWITPTGGTGGGSPGGATTQVQFNDSGAFNGDAGLTYDKAGKILTVGSQIKTTTAFGGIVFNAAGSDGLLNVTTNHEVGLFLGSGVVMDYQGGQLVVTIASNYALGWTASGGANGLPDIALRRNAAGVLEVDNGTAGTFADIKAKNVIATGTVTGNGTVPVGGANASVLTKNSNTDYDASWKPQRSATKVIWLTAPTQGTAASGTYTPTSGARAIYVEVVGAGGGSAGCVGTASNTCVAGGGAGGSYAAKYYSTVSASYTYTVGGGGNGGAAGLNAGGQGDDTLFNSSPVLTGYGGGGAVAPGNGSTALLSGAGGAFRGTLPASNGDAFAAGQSGALGLRLGSGAPPPGYGGAGGASILATGTQPATNTQFAGVAGSTYGGGAAGSAAIIMIAVAGGVGGNGAIKITEFF